MPMPETDFCTKLSAAKKTPFRAPAGGELAVLDDVGDHRSDEDARRMIASSPSTVPRREQHRQQSGAAVGREPAEQTEHDRRLRGEARRPARDADGGGFLPKRSGRGAARSRARSRRRESWRATRIEIWFEVELPEVRVEVDVERRRSAPPPSTLKKPAPKRVRNDGARASPALRAMARPRRDGAAAAGGLRRCGMWRVRAERGDDDRDRHDDGRDETVAIGIRRRSAPRPGWLSSGCRKSCRRARPS